MGGVPHIIVYRLASIKQRDVVAAFLNASRTFFCGQYTVWMGVANHWSEVDWTGPNWTHRDLRNKLINHRKQN